MGLLCVFKHTSIHKKNINIYLASYIFLDDEDKGHK